MHVQHIFLGIIVHCNCISIIMYRHSTNMFSCFICTEPTSLDITLKFTDKDGKVSMILYLSLLVHSFRTYRQTF